MKPESTPGLREMDATVTVIIPCYNVEDYIGECLDSVASQGGAVGHTYCVDNGCKDSTRRQIEAWLQAHPGFALTVLEQPVRGACAARNAPLALVETEWVQFLDADDLLLPGKLEAQLDACGTDADVLYDSSIWRAVDGRERAVFPCSQVLLGLMSAKLGITSSNLFRTQVVHDVNGWDEALTSSQEYDFMHRLFSSGARFQKLDTRLTVIRARPSGQISQSSAGVRKNNAVNLRERILKSVALEELPREERRALLNAFLTSLRWLYVHDPTKARHLHDLYLTGEDFQIQRGEHVGHAYLAIYRLLGFDVSERVRLTVRRLLGR